MNLFKNQAISFDNNLKSKHIPIGLDIDWGNRCINLDIFIIRIYFFWNIYDK